MHFQHFLYSYTVIGRTQGNFQGVGVPLLSLPLSLSRSLSPHSEVELKVLRQSPPSLIKHPPWVGRGDQSTEAGTRGP